MTILTPTVVEAKEEQPIEWTPAYAESFARDRAKHYGINEWAFVETLRCESMNFKDPAIQSGHINKKGERENSWGYAQFWLTEPMEKPDGTLITKEDAINPAMAIDLAAWHFSEGRASRWTCWKMLPK